MGDLKKKINILSLLVFSPYFDDLLSFYSQYGERMLGICRATIYYLHFTSTSHYFIFTAIFISFQVLLQSC